MTDRRLVVVEWLDAWTKDEGAALDDAKGSHAPTVVHTIGWVLYEDEVGISLANEYYDDYWRGRTFIPRGMIKEVIPFKLSKPRKKKETNEST